MDYLSARTWFKYHLRMLTSLQSKLKLWTSELGMKKTFVFKCLAFTLKNEDASTLNES
jgi:hypothetical protein